MTEITDASLDRYFREGTSIEGVKALLRAGAVYVNGAAVPGSERGAEDFVINDFPSLWKTGEGTWAYSVHKLYSADDLSFEAASLGFIQGISKMRGLDIRLYSADGVYADRMEVLIKESTLVNSMEKTGDTVRIGRYDFALATNEIRPDVNDISFPAANVDPNLRVGDIALYWCENGVWHIQQAVAAAGTLTQGSGEEKFILNDTAYADALITRYNLQAANRTSQFLTAHTALSLQDYPVTMWSTETGYPIGFTRGGGARETLAAALANAEAIAKALAVSADGSNTAASERWMTAEDLAAFDAQLAAAKAALADSSASALDLDRAVYELTVALDCAAQGTKA